MAKAFRLLVLFFAGIFAVEAKAGEIITNARLDGTALTTTGANLVVRYDKYLNLPYPVTNPFSLVNTSKGLIEFGIDETKKLFHTGNFTSIITFTYNTKDFNLAASGPLVQTLLVNYFSNQTYTPQAFLNLPNVSWIEITNIQIQTYKDYGQSSQALVSNPNDLYLENSITVDETLSFDYATALPLSAQIGHNVIGTSPVSDVEAWWDYLPGAEAYELEWIYIDDYDAAGYGTPKSTSAINYDFEHDATRIVTHNQYYRIPLAYERGWIIFRVRGIGRSQTNNNVRLEGTWSNSGYVSGTLSTFIGAFSGQAYQIATPHQNDVMNWSSTATYAEDGKSGIGVNYHDGLMKSRQSVAKLNTEDKTMAQSSLYDWQGRPAIAVLPAPVADNFLSYKTGLNKTSTNTDFDKTVFDNQANFTNACNPQGLTMDPGFSNGAAKYYSPQNPDQDAQQALLPDAHGLPYVQVDYYPDQTGRIRRQSLPGSTHFLGSGKESKFYDAQPTQQELVRLFGTEVGLYDEYEKNIDVDANGQKSVTYKDGEGRVVATGLMGTPTANLVKLADASDPATTQSFTTTLSNNNNDPSNYVLSLSNSFFANQGETEQISYDVTVPQYQDTCIQNMCLDCIYELDLSLTDDCGNELLDGDPSTPGNQPYIKILGRYYPSATPQFQTTCGLDTMLHFSLSSPTPYTFNVPADGTYHLTKTLKLSTLPLQYYAQEYVANSTCVKSLTDFQQQNLSNIDLSGCDNLDCAQCSTTVNTFVASLPPGTLTSQQVTTLLQKCQLQCDMLDFCESRKKLLLKDFKPGGYFAKYDPSQPSLMPTPADPTYSLSLFNSSNSLYTVLGITGGGPSTWYANPPSPGYGTYTTTDPITSTAVAPSALTGINYIATYTDDYANPWLKWHPEYCKLQFTCDPAISAISSYSTTLVGINSFDDACRLGYLFALPTSTALPNAPNSTTCPGCTGVSNHYFPLYNYTGTTYLTTTQINTALASLTSSLSSQTFHDDYSNTVSGDVYQFGIAMAGAVDITTIGSAPFGSNSCDRDREWLFYKQLYLNMIATLVGNLEQSFITGWNSSNGGCLTNFSSLPGYVKIFNDQSGATNPIISGYGNGTSTTSSAASNANSTFTAQCASYCHSYVSQWMTDLSPCSITTSDWPNVQAGLEAVCNGGCDANNPFGASTSAVTVTITVGTGTVAVGSFQDVLDAYGYTFNDSCNMFLISAPSPQGHSYSGAAATTPTLDACGCDAILKAHNSYTTGIANSTINACTMSEAEYITQQLGVTLAYPSAYVCACSQAHQNNGSYDFSGLSDVDAHTLTLPEGLACQNCIPCAKIQGLGSTLHRIFGSSVSVATMDPTILTNYLNQTYNMNNTYDQWITFIKDCANNLVGGSFNGLAGMSYLTTTEANDFPKLFNSLAANNFLIPNTTSSYYILNSSNAAPFFGSSLWNPTSLSVPTASVLTSMSTSSDVITIVVTSTTIPGYTCSYNLMTPTSMTFPDFTTVSSVSFYDVKGVCNKSNSGHDEGFVVSFSYVDASSVTHTMTLTGNNTCYTTLNKPQLPHPQQDICQPYLCSNSLGTQEPPPNNCLTTLINNALNAAQTQYNTYITQQVDQFLANYKNYCYAHVVDTTERIYSLNEYHYTLYYYDRAGNLVHTVPPSGVDVITNPTTISNAVASVNLMGSGTPVYPNHSLNQQVSNLNKYVSHNQYNTYDAPVTKVTPDGGETNYYYDYVGRLGVSQNSQQMMDGSYQYTLYDNLGRITETGIFSLSTALGDVFTPGILKDPAAWSTFIGWHPRREVTHNYYDDKLNVITNAQFSGGQQNLRNRLSATTFEWFYDNDPNTYDYGSFYSYDDHGNLAHLVQDNPQLAAYSTINEYKHIEYEYELISNNMTKVIYQRGQRDQMFHKYEYDADNRLHTVYTSDNDLVYQRDAKYFYYQHGPAARHEAGEKQVQGTDFAYTIQGWVKGQNSTILSESTDIGKDGASGSAYMSAYADLHKDFGKDAASYSLNYYTGDYNPIKAASQNFLADMTNLNASSATGFKLSADAPDLYDGNITGMVTSIYDMNPLSADFQKVKPQITGYRYDQLHRIKFTKSYSSLCISCTGTQHQEAIDLASNQWITPTLGQNYINLYRMNLSYDKIGNIDTLMRNGDGVYSSSWTVNHMDNLVYHYATTPIYVPSLSRSINTNSRLDYVSDAISSSAYPIDIDNQSAGNYGYDATGNQVQDLGDDIQAIEWTNAHKVKSVTRVSGSTKADVYFTYDGFGRRVSKTVVGKTTTGDPDPTHTKTTHYVLDIEGNTISIYDEVATTSSLTCVSRMLYGKERMGINNHAINMVATIAPTSTFVVAFGEKTYEMDNQLGNVITTISDRKLQEYGTDANSNGLVDFYRPDIVSVADYYAFGQLMPGRHYGDYRYAHNGQEKDDEIYEGALGAEFWEYDARIGRRWDQDPIVYAGQSPYACFHNNPILLADTKGDFNPPLIVSGLIVGAISAIFEFSSQFAEIYGGSLVSAILHPGHGKMISIKAALNKIDFADVGFAFLTGFVEGMLPGAGTGIGLGIAELIDKLFASAVDYRFGNENGDYMWKNRRLKWVFGKGRFHHKSWKEALGEFKDGILEDISFTGIFGRLMKGDKIKEILHDLADDLLHKGEKVGEDKMKEEIAGFFENFFDKIKEGLTGGGKDRLKEDGKDKMKELKDGKKLGLKKWAKDAKKWLHNARRTLKKKWKHFKNKVRKMFTKKNGRGIRKKGWGKTNCPKF